MSKKSEREAIVVWLRSNAPPDGFYRGPYLGQQPGRVDWHSYRKKLADAIESGEHIKSGERKT